MEGIVVDDGRADAKAAEALLREYMRGHLDEMAVRFGVQMNVSDALADDLAGLRDPERQDWGMLVAWADGAPLGCVVLRALPDDGVEVDRLYVRPGQRRRGLGRRLAEGAVAAARMAGAATIRLNAHDAATAALALAGSLGFAPAVPYPGHAVPEDRHDRWAFMERTGP